MRRSIERLSDSDVHLERTLARARSAEGLRPETLLVLQAGVYRYTHELELASKLVDKSTGAVRQTLQSQS